MTNQGRKIYMDSNKINYINSVMALVILEGRIIRIEFQDFYNNNNNNKEM